MSRRVGMSKQEKEALYNELIAPILISVGINPSSITLSRIQCCGNYKNLTLCIEGPCIENIEKAVYDPSSPIDNRPIVYAYIDKTRRIVQSFGIITLRLFHELLYRESPLTSKKENTINGDKFRTISFEEVKRFIDMNPKWEHHFIFKVYE